MQLLLIFPSRTVLSTAQCLLLTAFDSPGTGPVWSPLLALTGRALPCLQIIGTTRGHGCSDQPCRLTRLSQLSRSLSSCLASLPAGASAWSDTFDKTRTRT